MEGGGAEGLGNDLDVAYICLTKSQPCQGRNGQTNRVSVLSSEAEPKVCTGANLQISFQWTLAPVVQVLYLVQRRWPWASLLRPLLCPTAEMLRCN